MTTSNLSGRSPLELSFLHAQSKGYRKISLKVSSLVFSLAPAGGRNPNAIYVKRSGEYMGKIIDSMFYPSRDARPTSEELIAIGKVMAEPKEAAINEGCKTGHCAICGRTLIAEDSVRFGIGPICADKLGFSVPKHDPLDDL